MSAAALLPASVLAYWDAMLLVAALVRCMVVRLWALVWLLQAVLIMLVSSPMQVGVLAATSEQKLAAWALPGLALYGLGLTFEWVGDRQLAKFKADPDNRGKVMDRGLWRYTRHPNYFGDACVWWGIWLVAMSIDPASAVRPRASSSSR